MLTLDKAIDFHLANFSDAASCNNDSVDASNFCFSDHLTGFLTNKVDKIFFFFLLHKFLEQFKVNF